MKIRDRFDQPLPLSIIDHQIKAPGLASARGSEKSRIARNPKELASAYTCSSRSRSSSRSSSISFSRSRSSISHGNGFKNRGSGNPTSRYCGNLKLVVTDPEARHFFWLETYTFCMVEKGHFSCFVRILYSSAGCFC